MASADVMKIVLAEVREALGNRGQAAQVDDRSLRVTWKGGGLRMLDITGFGDDDDVDRIRAWARSMLIPATSPVPDGLLPVIWAERGAPEDAFTVSVGVGLVVGVLRDEVPVGALEAASWGAEPDDVLKAARRTLASHPFTPQPHSVDDETLVLIETPAAAANAWALFPTLLKSATGVDDRQVVFLPDEHVCCVVAAPRTTELAAAQQWAAVRYAGAQRPVSPAAYVFEGGQLVRWNG